MTEIVKRPWAQLRLKMAVGLFCKKVLCCLQRFRAINLLKSAPIWQLIAALDKNFVRERSSNARSPDIACEAFSEFRSGKPGFYPDQSVYAEYACAEFGLAFRDIDGGSGLLFSVASRKTKRFISAPGDAHGIRKTTPPPRRWHPTNISPIGFLTRRRADARRRIFLPARPHRAHRPRAMSATTRSHI
jgi:hypothetical protein